LLGKWLEATVGSLRARPFDPADVTTKPSRLVDTIWSLKAPLLTTNYDTLLEQVTRAPPATWQNTPAFRHAVLGDDPRTTGHIHGVWDDHASVILDPYDYGRLSIHEPTTEGAATRGLREVIAVCWCRRRSCGSDLCSVVGLANDETEVVI
jgi:hypothetical protein